MKKIAVIGLGYVGLSVGLLLARNYNVVGYDIDKTKIQLLRNKLSPLNDIQIRECLQNKDNFFTVSENFIETVSDAYFVVVATPTDFDEDLNSFNTKIVEQCVEDILKLNKSALIVIKSTISIGLTRRLQERYGVQNICFSPEFLREGQALYDNLHPSRIVVGGGGELGSEFGEILRECSEEPGAKIIITSATEAEAIKLFSNAYLATRVAFFNEIDSFCHNESLSAHKVISAVCADPRIGSWYNNPSFGYGGYCLPKDTRQLLSNMNDSRVPTNLISATIEANRERIDYISAQVIASGTGVLGVYKLAMKAGSDNARESAILRVVESIKHNFERIIIFEDNLGQIASSEYEYTSDLGYFLKISDKIITNRMENDLRGWEQKIFTRDQFGYS